MSENAPTLNLTPLSTLPLMKPQPKLKNGFKHENIGLPFPNYSLGKTELPSICHCVFDGTKFYVTNEHEMHILHHNGAFGISSLTNRGPSYQDPIFYKRPYYAKLFEKGRKHNCPLGPLNGPGESFTSSSNFDAKESKMKKPRIEIHQIHFNACGDSQQSNNGNDKFQDTQQTELNSKSKSDSDEDENFDSYHREGNERFIVGICTTIDEERLILMPEEVIFLSFGVGCLSISNFNGDSLGYRTVWKNLVESDSDFPISYAVYHYFRSKNWVPKTGDSYGASYVLYEVGPNVHHGTYVVHILGFPSRPSPTWTEIHAWVRLAGHVSKRVLLCEVSLPSEFQLDNSEPRSIFQMCLKETSILRWTPNQLETPNLKSYC